MGVTALVMAGGKGRRMALGKEKPLLKVAGKPMIEHILSALEQAEKVDEIVVAVSQHTPDTANLMKSLSLKVSKTPGKGYVSDMQYAIRKLGINTVLVVSADLPLVTGDVIDRVIERYTQCGKPALTVAVPVETKERLGLGVECILESADKPLVPVGINMIDGRRIDEGELEEDILVIDDEKVAVNVNTPIELRIAERLLAERPSGGVDRPREY